MKKNNTIYLDYASTTPVDPRVASKMMEFLTVDGEFGNPASRSHRYGWKADEAVEEARSHVSNLVNCDPREIVWTSGATEADNLAIKGVARFYKNKGNHIITSKIEHKAVLDPCRQLEREGFEVTYLEPDDGGIISPEDIKSALKENTILVSIMHINNELGTINNINEIGKIVKNKGAFFHVDAAQSTGKVNIDLKDAPIDLMSFSAHKTYGPKGIGALYVRRKPRVRIEALLHGGGHERGMRSGTLATHQIVGMGEAFRLAKLEMKKDHEKVSKFHKKFLDDVDSKVVDEAFKNSPKWFGKKYKSKDVVSALFNESIKYYKDPETGDRSDKYPANYKLKLPYRDGEFKVEAYDHKQNKIDIKKQAALKKLKDKTDLSNIAYLLEHYRSVYDTYFYGVPSGYSYKSIVRESDGKEISRDERPIEWKNDRKGDAVEASMKQFFGKLEAGELASLGFSIFAFVVSVILTLTASILLYTTGKNSEVKASFTSGLGKKSNALLSGYRDDLDEDK